MSADHPALMPHEWPEDRDFGQATTGKVGMWVFLLSDAFMFGGFLLAYGILRGGTEQWIGAGEPELGINFTALLTFILICSSVTLVYSYSYLLEKNLPKAKLWLALTALGGILFLCGQYKEYFGFDTIGHLVGSHWLAEGLTDEGLIFGQSAYASTFYLVTSFHGAHVFTGVCLLLLTLFRMHRGAYDDGNYNELEVVGLFWHFVDLVWILVFTFVYLI